MMTAVHQPLLNSFLSRASCSGETVGSGGEGGSSKTRGGGEICIFPAHGAAFILEMSSQPGGSFTFFTTAL